MMICAMTLDAIFQRVSISVAVLFVSNALLMELSLFLSLFYEFSTNKGMYGGCVSVTSKILLIRLPNAAKVEPGQYLFCRGSGKVVIVRAFHFIPNILAR